MTHVRLERQLSAYLDHELTAEEITEVRLHLEHCRACQEELARLRGLKQFLGALAEREAPAELWVALRRGLETPAPPAWRAWLEVLRGVFRRPAVAAAAFACVILLIALPLVKGQIDRLRAAETGVDVYIREHALVSAEDPFVDRAYLGLVVGDANLALVGEPRRTGEDR